MLRTDKVSFSYSGHTVVDSVTLAVEPGQVIAILGPNGAGKTTLFKLLSGSVQPDNGKVTLDDRPLNAYPTEALARRRSVLPQVSQLGFNFTVREVVEMGRLPHAKVDKNVDEEAIVDLALKQADITQFADRHYLSLSGGERQRVQLARALAQVWPDEKIKEGRYLLLDEPTNNLDISHQHACLREARNLAAKGVGVACILHDFNLALAYADTCVVLYDGMVRAAGPIAKALTAEVVSDVFEVEATMVEHDGQRMVATRSKPA